MKRKSSKLLVGMDVHKDSTEPMPHMPTICCTACAGVRMGMPL